MVASETSSASAVAHENDVHLVGRLAAAPVRRELTSGDVLVQFRLVVDRGPARRATAARSPTVDSLDCSAWGKDVQRTVASCQPGDVLEVHGALRRRFWRAESGPVSRSEVEVRKLTRRARAG